MKLLILCVETNKKAKTDDGYIDTVLKYLYRVDSSVKLKYKYFNGKGGYNSSKVIKDITKDIGALKNNSSWDVVYFIDTDNYDSDSETSGLNEKVQEFCLKNGYKFVWFCRNIEEVFLHKKVDDANKIVSMGKFMAEKGLGKATLSSLSSKTMSAKRSNILLVMDEILERKN